MKTKEKNIEKEQEVREKGSKTKNVVSVIRESRKLIVSVLIVVVIISFVINWFLPNERKVTTIAESTLKEVIEESQLSTVEFIYNSITTVSDKKNKPKYHVAYKGTVKAGFDFNKITTEVDEKNKKIVIIIPEIKINSVNINDKSFDFIFKKEKYDTETTLQEAYRKSYEDLEKKAETNETIKKMAYENAIDGMKAITIPLESKLPEGYSFEFREESEKE